MAENESYEIVSSGVQPEPEVKEEAVAEVTPELETKEVKEPEQSDQPKEKSRAQKRIEKLSQRTHELEREIAELKNSRTETKEEEINPSSFDDYDDYLKAVDEQSKQPKKEPEPFNDFGIVLKELEDKFDDSRDIHDDFDEKVRDTSLPLTQDLLRVINESDNAGEVAYYLATNLNEAKRISSLPAIKMAVEIGKIEVKLNEKPSVVVVPQKTTKAPEPINPLSGSNEQVKTLNDAQDYSEYESMRKAQSARKTGWA